MSSILTVHPGNKSIEVSTEETVLAALKRSAIYVKSSCGGHASCSDCIVKLLDYTDAHINEIPFDEEKLLGNVFHITKERLACQLKLSGDVTIDVSKHNEDQDQQRIKDRTSKDTAKIIKRKKDEVSKLKAEKEQIKKEAQEAWMKHWEDPESKKIIQGGRRPRSFRQDLLDKELEKEKEEKED